MNRRRQSERGSIQGCCCTTVLGAILICGLIAVLTLTSIPPGVTSPTGTQNGTSNSELSAAEATTVISQLVTSKHAEMHLSERDLTLLGASMIPSPSPYEKFIVTTWKGEIVVAGLRQLGPLPVWQVAYFTLAAGPSSASITLTLTNAQIGSIGVPKGLLLAIAPLIDRGVNVAALFTLSSSLAGYGTDLDCVSVTPTGVVLWIHRPTVVANPGLCG